MKKLISFVILFAALALVSVAQAETLKVLHKKTFQVGEGKKLKLESDAGDVVIKTSATNEVTVVIYGNEKASDKMEFAINETDYGVFVSGKKEGSFLSNLFSALKNVRVKYEIQLPQKFNTEISTAGGDVKVNNLNGSIDVSTAGGDISIDSSEGAAKSSTAGGDIKFKNHVGDVKASTAGGDIIIATRNGDVDANTTGGDIKIYCSNSRVDASTAGGNIRAEIDGDNRGVDLSTIGGDVFAAVSESANAEIELNTLGGDASLDISGTKNIKTSSSKVRATLNGGGKKIELSSTGGDVKLTSLRSKN